MIIVIRSERSVATRARPKIEGLLSVFSLIPSYRYSPPKRDRTGPNHDRLNTMMIPLVKALIDGERRRWRARVRVCWGAGAMDYLMRRALLVGRGGAQP